MKRATIAALIAVPIVMMAQGYTLVITHTNGTKTEIPTEEISNMEFVGDTPVEPTKLETPYVSLIKNGPDSYILAWSKVSNAASYGWKVDDGNVNTATGSQVTINNLTAGSHTVSLWANPAPGSGYSASDPRVSTITVELVVRTTVITAEQTSISASVSINSTGSFIAGIVPATVTGASAQINYVKSNSAAQRVAFDATPGSSKPLNFSGLTANTSYNIVVFSSDATDQVNATAVRTATNLNPGDKATVYPPGVTATSGWVDVDKVGNLSPYDWEGQDNLMCWACAISGMVQWWLNDYKAKTGHDFETVYPIPTESKCYSTPIMDLYVNYYSHSGGSMFDRIKWFFAPVLYNWGDESGDKVLNESLPNWKGGFAGMTSEEAQKLMIVNEKSSDGYNVPLYEFNVRYEDFSDATELAKVFSRKMVDCLHQGPVAVHIVTSGGSSVHGVSCWGADYEMLSDGSLKISKLYISENDPLSGNIRNGLNPATITYEGSGKSALVKIEMSTTNGKKNLNQFFGIRGYQGN